MTKLNEKKLRLCPRCGHLMDLEFCPDCGVDTLRTISASASRQRYKRRAARELEKQTPTSRAQRPQEAHHSPEPAPLGARQLQILLNHYDRQERLKECCRCCHRFGVDEPPPKARAEARIARLTPEERRHNFTVGLSNGIPVEISTEAAILLEEYEREDRKGLCPDCANGHPGPCPYRKKA
jgi:hypothetical protein